MSIDFGARQLIARTPSGRVSFRLPRRTGIVVVAAVVAAVAIALVSLSTGDLRIPIGAVVDALLGRSSGLTRTVVLDWRLPRVLLAGVFGIALGLSGAIFQSLTRNPLGSPDIIGFDSGAYAGALVVQLALHLSGVYSTTVGALVGGLATAAVVYALAWRKGVHGFRLILVGIGVGAMLSSFTTYLLLTASQQDAIRASFWGAGSLDSVGYAQLWAALVAFALLFPSTAALSRSLGALDLGDDAATQLGVNVPRTRLLLVLVGVALSATVTSLAGPIAFVALSAPQIARRLTRSAGISLGASAALGCVLFLAADWMAQHAFGSVQLPTGLVTVVLGGGYFVWLLIREVRHR